MDKTSTFPTDGTWRSIATLVAAILAVVALLCNAWAQTSTATRCSYWNDDGKSADGPCRLREATVNGHFAYVLAFANGTRVTVEYLESQSGYHLWNINGQRGFGVELSRNSMRGATLDLKQTVEWEE